jgi:methionyl-tRNA formyltransferase
MTPTRPARILLCTYGEIGPAAVRAVAQSGHALIGVMLPSNRTGNDVEKMARHAGRRGVPVLRQPPRRRIDEILPAVRRLAPDLMLIWSYSMILPTELIAVPRLGAVNLHGGLLPEYRGGHVMQWAIINGEAETGATLHYVDAGVDTGSVIAESRFPIEPDDDAASVRQKLITHGEDLLAQWLPIVSRARAPGTPQDLSRARYHRLRTPEDGAIDWNQPAPQIVNLVRALVPPWPGAYTSFGARRVVVRKARIVPGGGVPGRPGDIVGATPDGPLIATASGPVCLLELEVDGVLYRGTACHDLIAGRGIRADAA